MTHDVFISHAGDDASVAVEVCALLEKRGLKCWMAPREVQHYSDHELFWIVRNGIRLSGMPAFGNVETDDHIWNLVNFVRTLPAASNLH